MATKEPPEAMLVTRDAITGDLRLTVTVPADCVAPLKEIAMRTDRTHSNEAVRALAWELWRALDAERGGNP